MPDMAKVMEALEHCSDITRKRCNPTCPYHERDFCETELASDALTLLQKQEYKDKMFRAIEEDWKMLKEQDYRGWLMDMFHKYGRDDLIALLVLHGEENLLADVLKEQDAKDNNVPNKRAAGERAEAGAEDPEDNQGNNGPLKRIDPADVMDGLRRLADSEILDESWREILADAMTLLWLRYER